MADSDAESFASALDDFDDSQVVTPAAEPAAGAPAATATDAATEVGAAKDSANSEEDGVPQAPYPLHRCGRAGASCAVGSCAGQHDARRSERAATRGRGRGLGE